MDEIDEATRQIGEIAGWKKDRPEWQNRVADEWVELLAKKKRLKTFLESDKVLGLKPGEYRRMRMQYSAMGLYLDILEDRMSHFETEEKPEEKG